MTDHINLLGVTTDALIDLVGQWGSKPFRAKQLQRWVHQRGVSEFGQMSDLAKDFRDHWDCQIGYCNSLPECSVPLLGRKSMPKGASKRLVEQ